MTPASNSTPLTPGARYRDANFTFIVAPNSNSSAIRAENSDFSHADLTSSNLSNARFDHCRFVSVRIPKADLADAIFRECDLAQADAREIHAPRIRLEDSNAQGCDASHAYFVGGRFSETNFSRARLDHVRWDHAEGAGVIFRGASLKQAQFGSGQFADADFRGADLSEANFTGADLSGADFRGAILDGVIWTDAKTENARFDEEATSAPQDSLATESTTPPDALGKSLVEFLTATLTSRPSGTSPHTTSDAPSELLPSPSDIDTLLSKMSPSDAGHLLASAKTELKQRGIDFSPLEAQLGEVLRLLTDPKITTPSPELRTAIDALVTSAGLTQFDPGDSKLRAAIRTTFQNLVAKSTRQS